MREGGEGEIKNLVIIHICDDEWLGRGLFGAVYIAHSECDIVGTGFCILVRDFVSASCRCIVTEIPDIFFDLTGGFVSGEVDIHSHESWRETGRKVYNSCSLLEGDGFSCGGLFTVGIRDGECDGLVTTGGIFICSDGISGSRRFPFTKIIRESDDIGILRLGL